MNSAPGKSGSPVDGVHDKDEIRQPGQKQLVSLRFDLRPHTKSARQANSDQSEATDIPQSASVEFQRTFVMPPDEQLIEIFESFFPAGDRRIGGDHLSALFQRLSPDLSIRLIRLCQQS